MAAIRRNLGVLEPAAIRVAVEFVTGLDRAVHVGDDNAVGGLQPIADTSGIWKLRLALADGYGRMTGYPQARSADK
jgi:hypothetical protein